MEPAIGLIRFALAAFAVLRRKLSGLYGTSAARMRLAMHGVTLGKRFSVHGRLNLSVHRHGRITIGDDVRMKSGFQHNPVGAARRVSIWVGKDAHLRIGNRVGMSNCTIVCMTSVTIHDQAFIGGGVDIYDTDFHSLDPHLRQQKPDPDVRVAPVVIGPRSFIGGNSIILKGVEIGADSIVGAGSVVRRNVPPGEIWAGNPARHIAQIPQRKTLHPVFSTMVSEG